ncbi:unnamed protein product [Brassica oleracea]
MIRVVYSRRRFRLNTFDVTPTQPTPFPTRNVCYISHFSIDNFI